MSLRRIKMVQHRSIESCDPERISPIDIGADNTVFVVFRQLAKRLIFPFDKSIIQNIENMKRKNENIRLI